MKNKENNAEKYNRGTVKRLNTAGEFYEVLADALEVVLEGRVTYNGFESEEVVFTLTTGGPHTEAIYNIDREDLTVTTWWGGDTASGTVGNPGAVELARSIGEELEEVHTAGF